MSAKLPPCTGFVGGVFWDQLTPSVVTYISCIPVSTPICASWKHRLVNVVPVTPVTTDQVFPLSEELYNDEPVQKKPFAAVVNQISTMPVTPVFIFCHASSVSAVCCVGI